MMLPVVKEEDTKNDWGMIGTGDDDEVDFTSLLTEEKEMKTIRE